MTETKIKWGRQSVEPTLAEFCRDFPNGYVIEVGERTFTVKDGVCEAPDKNALVRGVATITAKGQLYRLNSNYYLQKISK